MPPKLDNHMYEYKNQNNDVERLRKMKLCIMPRLYLTVQPNLYESTTDIYPIGYSITRDLQDKIHLLTAKPLNYSKVGHTF